MGIIGMKMDILRIQSRTVAEYWFEYHGTGKELYYIHKDKPKWGNLLGKCNTTDDARTAANAFIKAYKLTKGIE